MTRFTEEDKERIRSELVAAGRELFARFGFKRTRVSDVTEAVGIGTSTFYQFFDSKEALYVAVLRAERRRLESRIDDEIARADTPREEVRVLLETMFEEVRSDPLISRLVVEGELNELRDRFSESERQSISSPESDLTHAKRWARLDAFRYDDPEYIHAMFQSLAFVTRSRDTVFYGDDEPTYERVESGLVDTIVAGLFVEDAE